MIDDLDETLRQLLIAKAGLDPAEVDISFEIPTRDWATSSAATRPTVNLYLYDIRENLKLREMYWDEEMPAPDNGRVKLKRRPVRMDLSYMVTCWTSVAEDQHRLLWRVLETLFRFSPLPEEILQGVLKQLVYPVRTEMAQPDGVLKNVSDFWGALENQLRPCVSLTVTVELDLEQIQVTPLVFARGLRFGQPMVRREPEGREQILPELQPGWEAGPVRLSGLVRDTAGHPLEGAGVRLIGTGAEGEPCQVGPSVKTDAAGRYLLTSVPTGRYTLVVEIAGQAPRQEPLTVVVGERGEVPPKFVHEVEVSMPGG